MIMVAFFDWRREEGKKRRRKETRSDESSVEKEKKNSTNAAAVDTQKANLASRGPPLFFQANFAAPFPLARELLPSSLVLKSEKKRERD